MAPGRRAVVLVAMVAIAVAIAAAWLAPAALLDPRIARATGGMLRLADADGTIRQGRGNVLAGATRIPVAWRVELWPLLRGVARVQLRSGTGGATPRATIAIGADSLAFHDLDVTFPAAVIGALFGPTAAGFVTGEFRISAEDIALTPGSSQGEARLAWSAARIAFAGSPLPLDLGNAHAVLKADGDVLSGPIANEGGDVALRGDWTMRREDSVRLTLHVTPRRPDLPDLERTLAAIGTADGNGWRIEWRVPLR